MRDTQPTPRKHPPPVPFCGRHVCRPYAWTERGHNIKTISWGERAGQNQRPSNPFACRGRVVCRGRIYAARQGCAPRGVYGKNGRLPRFVGRGLDPAEPMIFQIIYVGQPPPQPKNGFVGQTGTGRMHAAPTNREKRHTNRKWATRGGWRRGQDPALQCKIHAMQTINSQPRRSAAPQTQFFVRPGAARHLNFSFLFFNFSFSQGSLWIF